LSPLNETGRQSRINQARHNQNLGCVAFFNALFPGELDVKMSVSAIKTKCVEEKSEAAANEAAIKVAAFVII